MGLPVPTASAEQKAAAADLLSFRLLHACSSIAPEDPKLPRFAVLLCGHASEYIRNSHGGVAALMKKMLADAGETWDTFHVVDGQIPSDDEVREYDGFVVTGSYEDAHGSTPWVLQLCEVIRKAYRMKKKLLGICFGHQVICRALGGRTGRATHGWELGIKKIVLTDTNWLGSSTLNLPSSLYMLEAHRDEVFELPCGGRVIASSDTTSIEIFAIGNQVLGVQGHPEFTEDIALDIVHSYSMKNNIPEKVVSRAKLTLQKYKADSYVLRQMYKAFLKAVPRANPTPCHSFSDRKMAYEESIASFQVSQKGHQITALAEYLDEQPSNV